MCHASTSFLITAISSIFERFERKNRCNFIYGLADCKLSRKLNKVHFMNSVHQSIIVIDR
ncbi:hypothetical protein METP3_01837 [Methanosarcinales archaeon]|nr:hypothetical protein METP3_01837 [Methanosarcinales archaeon]